SSGGRSWRARSPCGSRSVRPATGSADGRGPAGGRRTMTTVGVIGLGKMGLPIAQNLMERGFNVVGYRRPGTAGLAARGGTRAQSAAEVASASDVLLSILPDVAALREVILGPNGTLTKLRPGTV